MDVNGFKTVGICGGGKMGLGFFDHITRFTDLNVVFFIRSPEKAEKIRLSYMRKLSGRVKRGEVRKDELPEVIITDDIELVGECDIVFEFIAEDVEAKRELFRKLINVRRKTEQVLVTGSSSLVPGKIMPENYEKNNLLGAHFIYPVQYIKAAEVIYADRSGRETVEKVSGFLKYLGKNPIPVHEEVGAFTIRILSRLYTEAFTIYRRQNISPVIIDEIVEKEGFAAPPYDLSDTVGLEIVLNSLKALYEGTSEYNKHTELRNFLEERVNKGDVGKKSGRGVLDYTGKGENCFEGVNSNLDDATRKMVAERLKMIYFVTCFKLLDGCWIDSELLDTVMMEIYSTPKGPIELACEYGLENTLQRLKEFSAAYDDVFNPPGVLEYAVKNNVGREEIDRQIRLFRMAGKRPDWYTKDIKQVI